MMQAAWHTDLRTRGLRLVPGRRGDTMWSDRKRLATLARILLAVDSALWAAFGVLLLTGAVSMGDVDVAYVRLIAALMLAGAAVLGVLAWQAFRGRKVVDYAAVLVVSASLVAFVFDQIGWIDLVVMVLHLVLLAVLILAIRAERSEQDTGGGDTA